MEKKILELLNDGDEIVAASEINPVFDPEEIKELTMNKIHQSEKKADRTKRTTVIVLAAALAAVLTATAFAAYRSIIAEQFDGYFGELTGQQAEVLEQIGTGEMPASTANGTTVTPLAVIGDDIRCYMKFRLEAPVGTQLPMTQDELKFLQILGSERDEWYSIVDENGKELAISFDEIKWTDTEPGDNVLEFIVCFSSDMNHPAHFNDGKSKILTIKGIWREGLDKEYTKLLDGPWSFDIGFYSGAGKKTLDVDGLTVKRLFNGVEYEDEGESMTLRSMTISPLTLTYDYDFVSPDSLTIPGPGTIHIVMKDGSIADTIRGGGFWTDSHMAEESIIQTPIDLDAAAYVQFGNQQIKIN